MLVVLLTVVAVVAFAFAFAVKLIAGGWPNGCSQLH